MDVPNSVGDVGPKPPEIIVIPKIEDVNVAHNMSGNILESVYATGSFIGTNLKTRLPIILIGSLTLIATLNWNQSINALIDQYVPPDYSKATNTRMKFLYTFVLTVIIIIIISLLVKYFPQ